MKNKSFKAIQFTMINGEWQQQDIRMRFLTRREVRLAEQKRAKAAQKTTRTH